MPVLDRAAGLLGGYDVVFSDVWGVLHNGVGAYGEAGEALARFRAAGGVVVLVSNAPTPAPVVESVLARVGVRRDAWDAIISSGDLTRAYLAERRLRRIHHLGPDRDLPLFKGLDVERVALSAASAIVCTGVVDDASETGDSYRPLLAEACARDLPLVCGNPDLVVDVGGILLPCAGAVAAVYESMGGEVYWAGKPHAPAYEGALQLAEAALGKPVERRRILAIGDAVRTDLAGAGAYGIDCLLVAQGIHRDELMPRGRLDSARLADLLSSSEHRPVAAMTALAW